jgi:ABC-type transport system involved in multi-copper enzyme maturation permease subunit
MRRLFGSQARLLFWKEIHQVTRSPVAIINVVALPGALVLLAPILSLVASLVHPEPLRVPGLEASLPGFQHLATMQDFVLYVSMPMLFAIACLLTCTLAATPILVSERERRSVELLAALPVGMVEIVSAKLLATLATTAAMILPMYAVDAIVVLSLTPAGTNYVGTAAFMVVAALLGATATALLLALIARDSRTAGYLSGLLAIPGLIVSALCVVFVPGDARFVVLGMVMLAIAGAALIVGARQLGLERYLL